MAEALSQKPFLPFFCYGLVGRLGKRTWRTSENLRFARHRMATSFVLDRQAWREKQNRLKPGTGCEAKRPM